MCVSLIYILEYYILLKVFGVVKKIIDAILMKKLYNSFAMTLFYLLCSFFLKIFNRNKYFFPLTLGLWKYMYNEGGMLSSLLLLICIFVLGRIKQIVMVGVGDWNVPNWTRSVKYFMKNVNCLKKFRIENISHLGIIKIDT